MDRDKRELSVPVTIMPVKVETFHAETADGRLWIDVEVDGQQHDRLGPFADEGERDRGSSTHAQGSRRRAGEGPLKPAPQKLSRQEAHDLGQIIKDRAKVLEANVEEQVAAQLADFERQISTEYRFDQDEVWEKAARESAQVVQSANEKIIERCKKLGIPAAFAPSIQLSWANRGKNMMGQRRDELRRAAVAAIEAMRRAAVTKIRKQALDLRTQVISSSMLSADGKLFLESLAPIEETMRSVSFKEIADKLAADRKQRQLDHNLLYGPGTAYGRPALGYDEEA